MRVVATIATLTGVYLLALASVQPWDVAIGAGLGTLVVWVFRGFMVTGSALAPATAIRRAMHFPWLALATGLDIVRGTVQMTRVVLSRDPARSTGFVAIPIGERSESGIAISALINTLSPGSVLVEVDPAAETWTIHTIDASEPAEVRADIDRFYEEYQRPVWP